MKMLQGVQFFCSMLKREYILGRLGCSVWAEGGRELGFQKTLILNKTENPLEKLWGPFVTHSENKQKFVCFPDSFLKHKKICATNVSHREHKTMFSTVGKN